MPLTIFQKARLPTASIAEVGSSKTKTGGAPMMAMARLSFRLFPPDSLEARVFAWGVKPRRDKTRSTFALTFFTPFIRAKNVR